MSKELLSDDDPSYLCHAHFPYTIGGVGIVCSRPKGHGRSGHEAVINSPAHFHVIWGEEQ